MKEAMRTPISIKTDRLRKTFNGLVAVDDLTVEVRKGEIFGLLGPNGAGKTTSIRMITGLLKPDGGTVSINGTQVFAKDNRLAVGICPQELVLWNNLTCMEQLIFMAAMYDVPAKIARNRAQELLAKLGLSEKRNKLAKTLSGGMLRRMNILMALMHDPEILILDEPEAGLDPQSRIMVRDFIRSLANTKTVVFTTHNMDEADRICDRITIIDHGRMMVTDSPETLKNQIGTGDKLEIGFSGKTPDLTGLKHLATEVNMVETTLYFRSKAIVDRIPAILDELSRQGIEIKGMQLRETTLEDVFISLTGRKLRE